MVADSTTTARWDELHADKRHQLVYPSEHVIRFLASLPDQSEILDIGCGSGRHMMAADDMGHFIEGCDISPTAIAMCRDRFTAPQYVGTGWENAEIVAAPMTAMPFDDELFDAALAYGVFYYGTHTDMQQAVNELHRVLKPGGQALVKTRTPHDWRAQGIPAGEPEHGMPMTFLDEHDIANVFNRFTQLTVELTETSTHARARWNSDWLITVTK